VSSHGLHYVFDNIFFPLNNVSIPMNLDNGHDEQDGNDVDCEMEGVVRNDNEVDNESESSDSLLEVVGHPGNESASMTTMPAAKESALLNELASHGIIMVDEGLKDAPASPALQIRIRKGLQRMMYLIADDNEQNPFDPKGSSSHRPKGCEVEGCPVTYSLYNFGNQAEGRLCIDHKLAGMVQQTGCRVAGCNRKAFFMNEGNLVATHCKAHKAKGMLESPGGHKHCEAPGCDKRPQYNEKPLRSGRFCGTHKLPGMVNVFAKRCEHDGCTVNPSFNFEGDSTRGARFCAVHKLNGMVDVHRKMCQFDGCLKQPFFNFEGQQRGVYCGAHKTLGMVDIQTRRCRDPGCRTRPCYNYTGMKEGIYCNQHKKCGMVNVSNQICEAQDCLVMPSYNFRGEKKRRFCAKHKQSGMINLIKKKKALKSFSESRKRGTPKNARLARQRDAKSYSHNQNKVGPTIKKTQSSAYTFDLDQALADSDNSNVVYKLFKGFGWWKGSLTQNSEKKDTFNVEWSGCDDSSGKEILSSGEVEALRLAWAKHLQQRGTDEGEYSGQGVIGLFNLGSTCYLNACLQVLLNTEEITESEELQRMSDRLQNLMGRPGYKGPREWIILELRNLVNTAKSTTARFNPSDFVKTFTRKASQFAADTQHDAQECLNYLLDKMCSEIDDIQDRHRTGTGQVLFPETKSDGLSPAEMDWLSDPTWTKSFIEDIFCGQQMYQQKCLACGHSLQPKFEPFVMLSIPIANSQRMGARRRSQKVGLSACLSRYFCQEELLDYTCDVCHEKGKCIRQISVHRLPKYLIIHLKRFNYVGGTDQDKIISAVDFPLMNLQMAEYYASPKDDVPYNLSAVVSHSGHSRNSGHYIAHCFNNELNGWLRFDDPRVTESKKSTCINQSDAYILFYKAQEDYK